MRFLGTRLMSVASLWVGMLLFLSPVSGGAQAPGAPQTGKPEQQIQERNKLAKQVEELRQAGRFDEAVAVAERTLDLERRAGEGNQARVAEALSRLAELHELRGDWPGAVTRRREALAVRERMDGKDHWRTADARLALAFAMKVAGLGKAEQAKVEGALRKEQEAARLDEQGKEAEEERVALEVVETYRGVIGPESPEVARVWHRIGRVRLRRSDVRGAKEPNEQAVVIRRKALPKDHPNLAKSLGNLGNAQYELREYEAAKRSYEEALAIFRKTLPPDHPDIALSLSNLGWVQHDLRDFAVAKRNLEEALAIYRKARPSGHPDIAWCLNNLGNVQRDLRDYAGARATFEEALAIYRKALPKDHPDIAWCLNNLGNVQRDLRDYPAAKASLEEALAIRRKALPKDDPAIAWSLYNLGNVQRDLRDYPAAKASLEEALAIRRRVLPKDHPDIADCLNNLGNVQTAPAGFCGSEGEPRGGTGHPPQGPAKGPSRSRRQPVQPGKRAGRVAGVCGGQAEP